jgi:hypothetical protein
MPRFYVHLLKDGALVDDQEGAEFDDINAVLAEAEQAGREMVAQLVLLGERIAGRSLEIYDDQGNRLKGVPLQSLVRL